MPSLHHFTTKPVPRVFLAWLLGLHLAVLLCFGTAELQAQTAQQPRFALLVGIGRYANLSEGEHLEGSRNDVAAMKSLLLSRFGFAEEDIVTLLDEQATGARIRAELARLGERLKTAAAPGVQPVGLFHFSGHGSQVLDQASGDPDCDEEDGLDETLVPYDATRQGGDQDIRDDEIYTFVNQACKVAGAKLWVVLDCCHSGSGARGVTKIRKLHRPAIEAHLSTAARQVQPKRLPPGAVFLSACQSQEVEPEYRDGDQAYGLMTRFMVEVLNEETALSKLSYDLLREAIITRYRGAPSVVQPPHPTLEYGDPRVLQETIVAGAGIDRRPLWTTEAIAGDQHRTRMLAGSLHGVTAGSLYELYFSPEQVEWEAQSSTDANGDSLLWLEVEKVEGSSATCQAFRWVDGQKTPAQIPFGFKTGYAVQRYREHGDGKLRVRVVEAVDTLTDGKPLAADDSSVPAAVRQALEAAVRKDESPWLQWVAAETDCDVVLRFTGNYAAIFPATGVAYVNPATLADSEREVPRALIGGWGPIHLGKQDDAARQIQDYLRRITRARNLLGIASRRTRETGSESGLERGSAGGKSPVKIRLELISVDEPTDDFRILKSHVWQPTTTEGSASGQRVMHTDDRYTFRVVNEELTGDPVYVTVLMVDSNMGIEQVHPYQPNLGAPVEGEQKLAAGQSLTVTDYFVCQGDDGKEPVYGQRWAIALATRTPNSFHLLAQEGLPTTRNATSALEQLLLEQTEFQSRSGFKRKRPVNSYDDSWGATDVQWVVLPK